MERKMNLLVFFLIVLRIDQSLSAEYWNFGNIDPEEDYSVSRSASVYRGLLLSYSPSKKHEICLDLFYAQLYIQHNDPTRIDGAEESNPLPSEEISTTPKIDDGGTSRSGLQYPLSVKKISTYTYSRQSTEKETILFTCVGKNFKHRQPNGKGEFILSTAFRPSWMYSTYWSDGEAKRLKITGYIGLSADHVQSYGTELEDQYVTIRRILNVLKTESPKYVELIEKKNDLSWLPRWKKLMLCASILSTPSYREDRLEYSQDWIDRYTDKLEYSKMLTLANKEFAEDEFYADGILCEGYVDADNFIFSETTKLYFTQSFDNKDSLIVLQENNFGRVFLSKYFKKVPLLMNAQEPVAESTLHQNFFSFSQELEYIESGGM